MTKVLLLEHDSIIALTIARALGPKEIEVFVASTTKNSISNYTKFCKKVFVVSDTNYLADIIKILKSEHIDFLLPLAEPEIILCSQNQKKISSFTKLMVPKKEILAMIHGKDKQVLVALNAGLNVPKTTFIKNINKIEKTEFSYPLIVKGLGGSACLEVREAQDKNELKKAFLEVYELQKKEKYSRLPFVQEFVPGDDYCFCALCKKGVPVAIYMYRILWKKYIDHGPGIFVETISNKELEKEARKLLHALKWEGIVEIDFRLDNRDNKFKFLEINPRFWTALAASVSAGVNFPQLYLEQDTLKTGNIIYPRKEKSGFVWVFPSSIAHMTKRPSSLFFLLQFALMHKVKTDIWINDLKPLMPQIRATPWEIQKIKVQ